MGQNHWIQSIPALLLISAIFLHEGTSRAMGTVKSTAGSRQKRSLFTIDGGGRAIVGPGPGLEEKVPVFLSANRTKVTRKHSRRVIITDAGLKAIIAGDNVDIV